MRYVPEIDPATVKVKFGSLNRGDFYLNTLPPHANHAVKLEWAGDIIETTAGVKFNAYSLTYDSFLNVDPELEVYKATSGGEPIKQFTITLVEDLVIGDFFSSPKIGVEPQLYSTVYQVVSLVWENGKKYYLNTSNLAVLTASDFTAHRQVVKLKQVED